MAHRLQLLAQLIELRRGNARGTTGRSALKLPKQASVLLPQFQEFLAILLSLLDLLLPLLVLPSSSLLLCRLKLCALRLLDLPLCFLLRPLPLALELALHVLKSLLLLLRGALCRLQCIPPLLVLSHLLDAISSHFPLQLAYAPATVPPAEDLLDPASSCASKVVSALQSQGAEERLESDASLVLLQCGIEVDDRAQSTQSRLHKCRRLAHGTVSLLLHVASPPLLNAYDVILNGSVNGLFEPRLQVLFHEDLTPANLPRFCLQWLLVTLEFGIHLHQDLAAELLVVRVNPPSRRDVGAQDAEAVEELLEGPADRVARPPDADRLQHPRTAELPPDIQGVKLMRRLQSVGLDAADVPWVGPVEVLHELVQLLPEHHADRHVLLRTLAAPRAAAA
mmetsp:Transcript_112673/g.313390  ORF Transcript_112673/g.313390 Transcript_112673/m.313390 type:complete len:394 (+) Transcript_112673:2492-3673(+)